VLLTPVSEIEVPQPEIKVEEITNGYGKFVIGPLERGYGTTLGNPLRRVLLSSIPGTAITWVKVEGTPRSGKVSGSVQHEYETLPHVKEGVSDLLMNFKAIRLRSLTDRPGKLRLDVQTEGRVTAGDILASADFEIANPELHIATLDSSEAKMVVEFNVEQGVGYVPAIQGDGLPIGVLPVDSIYTPVRRVNFAVDLTRVGHRTDFELLVLEIWTDETLGPLEALSKAGELLVDQFFLFANIRKIGEAAGDLAALSAAVPAEVYNMAVEKLDLSARTLNCLKRAHINRIGEVLEREKSDLLKIRNFGQKSLDELFNTLEERGYLPKEGTEPLIDSEQQDTTSLDGTDYQDELNEISLESEAN
jgi:DNA-directed RNA polymerase subunit alpha